MTRLEILCKLHNQQGGAIHQFNQKYGMDILTLNNKAFFKLIYGINLKKDHNQFPGKYSFPENEILIVWERMCDAINKFSFNKDSHGFKWTCKALGIPHTYKAISEFLNA